MTHTTKHTPLSKAIRAIPMLYAEAFAGSNNKEFVMGLYKDARLLETAAPAMYEALKALIPYLPVLSDKARTLDILNAAQTALAQAEGTNR